MELRPVILSEKGTLIKFHPIVNLVYFLLVFAVIFTSNHPLLSIITFTLSTGYLVYLEGIEVLKRIVAITLVLVIIMSIINGLFSHNGVTILFFLNNNRITLEAFMYGANLAMIISCVIWWFEILQKIITTDKWMYLFGRISPSFALTLSMVFRFIPLVKRRFLKIRQGQKSLGRKPGIRQSMKEVSILIAWSLESAIETGDSMEARGYGLKGRTSFHLYSWTIGDIVLLGVIFIIFIPVAFGMYRGVFDVYFFPAFSFLNTGVWQYISFIFYTLFLALPLVIDIIGELSWKRYALKM